jgi:transcriptional regulator with XRE-family HTH domain
VSDEDLFDAVPAEIGARIAAFRQQHGYGQKEFAEMTGIPRQQIGRYETGTEAPRLRNLLILHRFMEISLDELVYGRSEAVPSVRDPSLRECVYRVESMGSHYCRGAVDLLEMYIVSKQTKKRKFGDDDM